MKKATTSFIIRIAVSLLVFGFLLSRINFNALKQTLSNFNPAFYLFAIFILFIHQMIWSLMWKTALSGKNISVKQKDIFRAVITSYFFGTFLPSAIGPDLVLTFNIGKSLPDKHHAPGSFIFIRLLNMSGILFTSIIAFLFIKKNLILVNIFFLTICIFLGIAAVYILAVHRYTLKLMDRICSKFKWLGFLYKIFHSFATFGTNKKILAKIWGLSLCMALLKVLIDYSMARSLGIRLPYLWFVALVPSVSIISLLPISIAGLGIREGAYMTLFANMGVETTKSFSISIMLFTLNIILCIAGGILYLIHGSKLKHSTSNRSHLGGGYID